MAYKLKLTDKICCLFKAFYDHDVPRKMELCVKLRNLISGKFVGRKGAIQDLLEDPSLSEYCDADLIKSIVDVTDGAANYTPDECRITINDHEEHPTHYNTARRKIVKYVCENLSITEKRLALASDNLNENLKGEVQLANANLALCINVLTALFEQ